MVDGRLGFGFSVTTKNYKQNKMLVTYIQHYILLYNGVHLNYQQGIRYLFHNIDFRFQLCEHQKKFDSVHFLKI